MNNKRYAVTIYSLSDNELKLEIVNAKDWLDALNTAFPKYVDGLSTSYIEARKDVINMDFDFKVLEIEKEIKAKLGYPFDKYID